MRPANRERMGASLTRRGLPRRGACLKMRPHTEVTMNGSSIKRFIVAGALLLALWPGGPHAQKETLTIALNQDPDILDPTLSRTYVGRIVFAQLCEKLYEIDEGMRIHPQLAAALPAVSPGMPVSPAAVQKLGDKFGTAPVCVGPWQFVERVPQDRIVVERSPHYFDKSAAKFDRVVFRIIPDDNVRVANLRSGDIDFMH